MAAEGAEVIDLGIVPDNLDATIAAVRRAREEGADVLVTTGGASVGEYDLVQRALAAEGMDLSFWKIAMRPGRPLMNGRIGPMHVLGLPGNPVSSYVCCLLFVIPCSAASRAARISRLRPNRRCLDVTFRQMTSGRTTCVRCGKRTQLGRSWQRHFRCRTVP